MDKRTETLAAEVARLYDSGHTIAEVSAAVGLSDKTVRKLVHSRRPGPRGYTHVSDEQIVYMRSHGATWKEIGAAVGMSGTGVRSRWQIATYGRTDKTGRIENERKSTVSST